MGKKSSGAKGVNAPIRLERPVHGVAVWRRLLRLSLILSGYLDALKGKSNQLLLVDVEKLGVPVATVTVILLERILAGEVIIVRDYLLLKSIDAFNDAFLYGLKLTISLSTKDSPSVDEFRWDRLE